MAVVHVSRVRAAALCVCLLLGVCDAVNLDFERAFTGLSAAAQLVATVDPCAQPTGQQSGTAVLSFSGLPNGFPSLPAGTSADVVVDCSLQAWTATATGASFSFPGSTAVVAPFDVTIADDSRLPVTTNVTISSSVTSSDGAIVLDLQDAFSSPYVATTRTLTFSGSGVAFGATYTTQPNCSGGTAVGVLSLSFLPAGLAALSNVAVNANVRLSRLKAKLGPLSSWSDARATHCVCVGAVHHRRFQREHACWRWKRAPKPGAHVRLYA